MIYGAVSRRRGCPQYHKMHLLGDRRVYKVRFEISFSIQAHDGIFFEKLYN